VAEQVCAHAAWTTPRSELCTAASARVSPSGKAFRGTNADRNAPPDATKEQRGLFGSRKIVAAANHSPCSRTSVSRWRGGGFEIVAIIDSSEGDLAGRLAAGGIRHYKVPMYFARNLDSRPLPLYVLSFPFVIGRIAWILRRERMDIAHSHISWRIRGANRLFCSPARATSPHRGAAASRGRRSRA